MSPNRRMFLNLAAADEMDDGCVRAVLWQEEWQRLERYGWRCRAGG